MNDWMIQSSARQSKIISMFSQGIRGSNCADYEEIRNINFHQLEVVVQGSNYVFVNQIFRWDEMQQKVLKHIKAFLILTMVLISNFVLNF